MESGARSVYVGILDIFKNRVENTIPTAIAASFITRRTRLYHVLNTLKEGSSLSGEELVELTQVLAEYVELERRALQLTGRLASRRKCSNSKASWTRQGS
ncbi:MAG: hypothetical protein NZ954_01555 [Thermofilaceae archaeon]|nr:hypothetical protein [Thermofilaceae archaeon]MCX8180443.1 hypothetical protein [Thermofilaceae archaeon]MDW8003360.1 hypothetical protein [Thermofilaceae archaeon]